MRASAVALEAILWISRGSRDELNAIESNNSTVTAGMARVDGFESAGALLIHIKSDTSALDKSSRESAASLSSWRKNTGFTSAL
ncbi:MAG TPA: hypothetical protein VHQ22_04150 [Terriglobales bacterium]|nr:hypothetical protein [Terriglobales bacterium]